LSLNRHVRLAPLLALASWLLATHCADPLADDCKRTLTCPSEVQGEYTLDPNCVWHYPDGSVWREGPTRDSNGDWFFNDGRPVGRTFVCGQDGISTGGSGGSAGGGTGGTGAAAGDGGGTGGTGGDVVPDAGPPEPTPDDPNCVTNNVECTAPTFCDEATGNCVGCVNDDSCTTNAPRCLVMDTMQACVACIADTDCTLPAFARCDQATHTCQPCNDIAQCARFTGANQCDPTILGGKCVQCLTETECLATPETPKCTDAGSCVQCTEDSHCAADRDNAHCDLTPGSPTLNTCIPCTDGNQCPDDFPLCSIGVGGAARCVACTNDNGCPNPAAADCSPDGQCVECTQNNQCTHLGSNLGVCALGLDPNRCVECVTNDDCDSDTASQCVNNQCTQCTNNAGCAGQASNHVVCDTSPNPNRCVECTGTDFASCNGFVCNSTLQTCTNIAPASAVNCATCVSDAQCVAGDRCVQQRFQNTNIGFFCLPLAVSGDCASRPFVGLNDVLVSIDGDESPLCELRATTCPGLASTNALTECASAGLPQSTLCGFQNVDDGVCVQAAGSFICTIPCTSTLDCPGSACSTTEPFVCGL
jgi:hypothetical protein